MGHPPLCSFRRGLQKLRHTTTNYNFTGDTQDTIAGTYDTVNRELNPSQGRWLSPDPGGMAVVDPANPQTWNRYAYVANNPINAIDPAGLHICWASCPEDPDPSQANPSGDGGVEGSGFQSGGASVGECGVDPFCIHNGGIGPFGSPVAQVHCDQDGCLNGSWTYSQYSAGGIIDWDWQAQRKAENASAVKIFLEQAAKVAGALGIDLTTFLAAQNLDDPDAQHPFLQGGNWNFLTGQTPGIDCRSNCCGTFPSLHFDYPGFVHMDTANPLRSFPAGALVHLGVDVILGNTIFAAGIPR
jgi:RHS repeat-associated protein